MSRQCENEGTEVSLQQVSAVSPSLSETLRVCPLRALLNGSRQLQPFILGSPKAWLGIAYHEVLEKLWSRERTELNDEDWIDFLWQGAVDRISSAARAHPLNRRFGNHEKWPGYHLTHELARIRAREALSERPRIRDVADKPSSQGEPAREHMLYGMDGKLKGQPDVVVGNEIWDYKSGSVTGQSPDGDEPVRQSYVRQLRLYGYLVQEDTGTCPTKARLLPMRGSPVEIILDPQECAAEAEDAVHLLDSVNMAVANGLTADEIATPSEESCFWCNHKPHCTAFWKDVTEEWWSDSNIVFVQGRLAEAPIDIHGGRSFALRVEISAGNVCPGQFVIGPFDKSVHENLQGLSTHEVIRIVGCFRRPDEALTTTPWTVCARITETPNVVNPNTAVS